MLFPELTPIRMLTSLLWGRLQALREDERGMTTETVIITAMLAGLAITACLIIINKVTQKADSIPTE